MIEPITPADKQALLIYLLREHGIGIASLDEMKARTLAVARGELRLPPDEPKLWFSSIDLLVKSLKAIGERAAKRAAKKEAKAQAAAGLTPIEVYIQEKLEEEQS